MSSVNIELDLSALDDLPNAVQHGLTLFNQDMKANVMPKLQRRLINILRVYPKGAKHPIQWTSERQRRFVMAKLTREDNLPYQRSGRFGQSWEGKVEWGDLSGSTTITNTSGIGQFMVGDRQQGFHKNTGWISAEEKAEAFMDEAAKEARDAIARALQKAIAG